MLLVGAGSGGEETLRYNFSASGHTEAQCATWCATCWGNADCHNCTGSSFDAGICTITVADSGLWWRIKNSWGGWGEDGFFRLRRGTQAGAPGMCGVAMSPLVPSDEPADSIQAKGYDMLTAAIGVGKGVGTIRCRTPASAGSGPCIADIASQCDAWTNCSGFAMSTQWSATAAQAYDGQAAAPTCNPDWDTYCPSGKCAHMTC